MSSNLSEMGQWLMTLWALHEGDDLDSTLADLTMLLTSLSTFKGYPLPLG